MGIDEFGISQTKRIPKIKKESLKRIKEEALIIEKEHYSKSNKHKVLKDVVEIDEFGNKKIVQKLVDEDGPKLAPTSNNVKSSIITTIGPNGEEIKKSVFIDDQGNIIDESDVEYISEKYIDEFGITRERNVPKIKEESLKRMKEEALKDEQQQYSKLTKHKVLKDVVEIDEFGNKKIVQKLVDEDGPNLSPKYN